MEIKITQPQRSDMGSGFGYIEDSHGNSLKDVLNWIKSNIKTWGTITVYDNGGNIVRKFDYNLHNSKNQFFHYLSGWQYTKLVEKVHFNYCFMCQDFDIYLQ